MKIKRLTLALILLIVFAFIIKTPAETAWVSFMNFINSKYYDMKIVEWSNQSTDYLIGKLGHPAPSWDGVAGTLLAKRKDLKYEWKIERIIANSISSERRSAALGVLFAWDEKKATEISMSILKSGISNPLFHDALLHLGKRKYLPAYEYAVELAKAKDRYENGSVAYLEDFGQLQSLPILEDMLKDERISASNKRVIMRAIQSIKRQNNVM